MKLLHLSISGNLCWLTVSVMMLVNSSCKKLIEIDLPVDKSTPETVFANTTTAAAAINSIYARLVENAPFVGRTGITIRCGMMADEVRPQVPQTHPEYTNDYTAHQEWNVWDGAYRQVVYRINSALDGLSKSSTLPQTSKEILIGEAKFARAFIYFYLTNLYGDVPLVLSTDVEQNSSISRSSVETVYEQIEADLLEAIELLPDNFIDKDLTTITEERVRPNKAAAEALLARIYLYRQQWTDAELFSTRVIENSRFEMLNDLNQVFRKNSKEAIWQIQSNTSSFETKNTPDGSELISPFGGDPVYFPSDILLNAFEVNDQRRLNWIFTRPSGALIFYKYREPRTTPTTEEYTMTLRLAEQYLIRAEARAQLNKLTGTNSAESDLNVIRSRAGLGNTTAVTKEDLITAIIKERQFELFVEWGHRWFDLKRTATINDAMLSIAPSKGTTWQPYKALLPIPFTEFQYNPVLRGHQNSGYTEE